MKGETEQKMSRLGIGPSFAFISICYCIVVFLLTWYFYPVFQIKIFSYCVLFITGIILIIVGIVFMVISVVTFTRAYNSNILVTSGIYRCCRHPLYASWVIFIVPGMMLLINSLIGLTTPIFMYFILRILIKKEEKYLENIFGSKYLKYKKKVPCIIPYGCLRKDI